MSNTAARVPSKTRRGGGVIIDGVKLKLSKIAHDYDGPPDESAGEKLYVGKPGRVYVIVSRGEVRRVTPAAAMEWVKKAFRRNWDGSELTWEQTLMDFFSHVAEILREEES